MPSANWPNARYLHPPRQYDTCWRCGLPTSRSSKHRACRDCRDLLALPTEREVWAAAS